VRPDLGFTYDVHRLNVAMSRARDHLTVVTTGSVLRPAEGPAVSEAPAVMALSMLRRACDAPSVQL
jgi:hypothetical protein